MSALPLDFFCAAKALAEQVPASRAQRGAGDPARPRFVNFHECNLPSCRGLCYNHHPFCDSVPLSEEEIYSSICVGDCAREYCHVRTCCAFWKNQKEICNLRERLARLQERHKLKSTRYELEIDTLRAVQIEGRKPSFADEVLEQFGESFRYLRSVETTITNNYTGVLRKLTHDNEQHKMENQRLLDEKESLRQSVLRLQDEVTRLQRYIGSSRYHRHQEY